MEVMYLVPLMALIGLVVMVIKSRWVNAQDAGDEKMASLAKYIREGALAFLNAEYRILLIFVIIAGILLGVVSSLVETTHWFIVIAFVIGAIFSAVAGNIGMRVATAANVRTTQAARTSLPNALKVSFNGGTVMGLGVAGLAVLGLSMLFILLFGFFMDSDWGNGGIDMMTVLLETLAGFSLGAESIALFARVGGGIYTKA
ncbi:MAG: sodium-translocating pyrophosphatase, partial [Flavobacteriales bacterium]|nr:sodium-translocating pyrophosphatase [Flavobacteriales bacterium]